MAFDGLSFAAGTELGVFFTRILAYFVAVMQADFHCTFPLTLDHVAEPAAAEHDECSVCMRDDDEAEEWLRVIKCKHAFHKSCLANWLNKTRQDFSCPNCRATPYDV
jgi:hypothetical protein